MVHTHQMLETDSDTFALAPALPRKPGSARMFRLRCQQGAIAIMFALMLILMLGFFGLAVGLSLLYNRKAELQSVADAVALSAARDLNGTPAGISKALTTAALTAGSLKFNYGTTVVWSNAAISFGSSAARDGDWMDAASANSSAANIRYVKIDTSQLSPEHGTVGTLFINVVGGAATATMSASAIAGPTAINVTPLAICAMSATAAQARSNPASNVPPPMSTANVELVEYGFRRGVGYDLMRLNPDGYSAPANFLVNPVAPPGTAGVAGDTTATIAGPFVCAGTMAMTRVTGGTITVSPGFPIGTLFNQLNSRFEDYASGDCDDSTAPPDANIRPYTFNVAARIPWMSVPNSQRATEYADSVVRKKLETVADPLPAVSTNTAQSYGVLWSFARAVPYSSYTGSAEPANGYTPFDTTAWATLYAPGKPPPNSAQYPSGVSTPYRATAGANFLAPSISRRPGIRNRRVLNVPLLACPVGGSSATVLAIGRFFMTVPATGSALNAEFAGIVSENALATDVELHP